MSSGHGHKCTKSIDEAWSVHGLWPTIFHKIAPIFCNHSWHYNHDLMDPIMDDMHRYWPDVEMRGVTDSLWSHEWVKHGTCACMNTLTSMKTQTEYFEAGVRLAEVNTVTLWLAEAGVVPSDTEPYKTSDVWDAVMKGNKGFRPQIECLNIHGQAYITEVKVCYDKNLTRVDCDGIVASKQVESGMLGSCLRYDSFIYPATIDPTHHNSHQRDVGAGLGSIATGVVCAVLGVGAVVIGGAYFIIMRYNSRRYRGYESL